MSITTQRRAIIASTWCIDSADSMSQWCKKVDISVARSYSPTQGRYTLAWLANTDDKAMRDLFFIALVEDDDIGDGPRWEYAEVEYGSDGGSIGRSSGKVGLIKRVKGWIGWKS